MKQRLFMNQHVLRPEGSDLSSKLRWAFLPSRRLILPALIFSLCTVVSMSQAADTPDVAGLESILAKRLPADGPGEVVLVARDGKILFSHGYGFADREKRIPTTPETRFRIGSVTKQFTAAAILHLAQEGKLSIDDSLAKYFPKYPGGEKITLRHLLTHTSGLHNYTAHPDFLARVTQPIASADLVAWFQDDPPDFPPGEQFGYCNTGYVLLGQIVEKVSGLPLGDYLQKQFFGPLGLHDTGTWHNATPPDHAAKGYSFIEKPLLGKQLQPAVDWDMSWAGGAGELYSTVGDLWHWTEALQGGLILSPEGLRDMVTEVTVPKKETLTLRYGMGLGHCDIGNLPAIGHNGGLNGFLSEVMWFPDQKVTVVVLGNAMPPPPGTTPSEIVPIAARAFLGPEMAAHAPKIDLTVNPKIYSDYVGRYDYKSGIQEVTAENGHIFAQLTGQNKFEIFPSGPDAFFFKVVEASMVFQRDKNGIVTGVVHTQNEMTFTAPKLSEKDVPVLSNETLDAIVGQYQYGPAAVLTVTRRGNQLYAQLTGQSEAPIFPKSDHEFFWRIVPASVEFVRGADGKIASAIHHQNGITFTAPKLQSK
ncbi:MAG: serine hydrolase [Methylacidiphilales bacterium]|nr:serine hydrolase [Candidatus Methylacidiphilales bacterium]